ncbi:hypothetical protein FOCC_FOCC009630 [Frankliniella occidentalis]|nr:hypothetical protein FOCC_FOCC009630 [Frankliniella occidentalis]
MRPEIRVIASQRGVPGIGPNPAPCECLHPARCSVHQAKFDYRKAGITAANVKNLLDDAIDLMPNSVWFNNVEHVKKIEERFRELDRVLDDNLVPRFIISLADESDTEVDEMGPDGVVALEEEVDDPDDTD